jgi:hypothetical protein
MAVGRMKEQIARGSGEAFEALSPEVSRRKQRSLQRAVGNIGGTSHPLRQREFQRTGKREDSAG